MKKMSSMVDMMRTDEDKQELSKSSYPGPASVQDYPYGLCISLTNEELEKLGMEHSDFCPGDMLHLHALAKVTSVSSSANANEEPHCRVELQLTHINAESEDEENEEDETESYKTPVAEKMAKMYK